MTNWVSWAYGPMAKMERGPPGEYILGDRELRPVEPAGDCRADGGSEGTNDAGDEGGATKCILVAGG